MTGCLIAFNCQFYFNFRGKLFLNKLRTFVGFSFFLCNVIGDRSARFSHTPPTLNINLKLFALNSFSSLFALSSRTTYTYITTCVNGTRDTSLQIYNIIGDVYITIIILTSRRRSQIKRRRAYRKPIKPHRRVYIYAHDISHKTSSVVWGLVYTIVFAISADFRVCTQKMYIVILILWSRYLCDFDIIRSYPIQCLSAYVTPLVHFFYIILCYWKYILYFILFNKLLGSHSTYWIHMDRNNF